LNVALFASAFYPHIGGVEELCRQLAHEYRRRGIGVIVLTNRWPRGLPRYEEVEGIPVHRLALRVAGESLKSKVTAATRGLVRRELMSILRRFQPSVLHVQCVSVTAEYALSAKAKLGVPLVVTLQGELTMDASQLFQRSEWARGVLRASLDGAAAITACSVQTLSEAEAWYGRPFGERGRVIYNGIALDDAVTQPWPHPRPYALAIGRHVPQKGFDVLLAAFARLTADPAFDHDLILAGNGTEHAALQAQAERLGLGGRVVFPGRVDHAMAMRLFAGCSFFVLPSRHEPFGIVNLEAMGAGKAIVATRVGGVPEIVKDGENGLLVPGEDVVSLAGALKRMAADTEFSQKLGRDGMRRSRSFAWPEIASQYISVYEQTIEGVLRQCGASAT
jgi:glycosyltransferase involved in cell wall biosynthesis